MKKLICAFIFTVVTIVVQADPPSVHGMLLFGDKVTYASHFSMYHNPHDYQVIMKLTLSDVPNSETLKTYAGLKIEGQKSFILVPEPFDLTKIIDKTITSFSAFIIQQDGTDVGPVSVKVESLVFSKKLDASEPEVTMDYLAFGDSGEFFAAHVIKGKPSFDHVVTLNSTQIPTSMPIPSIIPIKLSNQKPTPIQKNLTYENTAIDLVDVLHLDDQSHR